MQTKSPQHGSIDVYIQGFPDDVQKILAKLRAMVKEEAPEAVETISYQMPAFKLNGKYLVYFAAWKTHIAFYPATSAVIEIPGIDAYRTGKGTFQFPLDTPIPYEMIRKIIRTRADELGK